MAIETQSETRSVGHVHLTRAECARQAWPGARPDGRSECRQAGSDGQPTQTHETRESVTHDDYWRDVLSRMFQIQHDLHMQDKPVLPLPVLHPIPFETALEEYRKQREQREIDELEHMYGL